MLKWQKKKRKKKVLTTVVKYHFLGYSISKEGISPDQA